MREALCRLWYGRDQLRRPPIPGETESSRAYWLMRVAVEQRLCQQLCADWECAYEQVTELIAHTVRASSAVEWMNSVLRMHQSRHRQVSQGMLELKRLFWNCRPFTHGKRRRRCPYQWLGLDLPTYDWWKLLQMDPDELEQKLSTQIVGE